MNLEFEACRNCPVQCRLEAKSKEIVTKHKKKPLTTSEVRSAVSTMTLIARNLDTPCPQQEITRVRQDTFEQIDPKLAKLENRFRYIAPQDQDPATRFPTDYSKNSKFKR